LRFSEEFVVHEAEVGKLLLENDKLVYVLGFEGDDRSEECEEFIGISPFLYGLECKVEQEHATDACVFGVEVEDG